MASNAADGSVIGSVLINLIDRHKQNALAEASGSILTVSLHKSALAARLHRF
jgi:hypothetical protein